MVQMINELQSFLTNPGFIEITNMGGFVASFSVSYNLNGQDFDKESGSFSLFFSRKIDIPANATNIHILVMAANGLGQWAPIYNNNWNTPGIFKAKLYGTIISPQIETLSDSKPPKFKISIENRAGFVCNYVLEYIFNKKMYSIKSGNFTLGITRNISIPESAENISIYVIQVLDNNTSFDGPPVHIAKFIKRFAQALNVSFMLSGTTKYPKIEQLASIPNIGLDPDPNIPLIKISKIANKTHAVLGEKISFTINISNISGSTAKMLILSENLPSEATFVENSFVLNGNKSIGNFLPTQGLLLNDIKVNDSIILSYEIIFNKVPLSNPIQDKPLLNYNYVDSKGKIKNSSIIGDVKSLNILNSVDSNSENATCKYSCCCCCCCKLHNLTYSEYNEYLSYIKSMGYI